ncbi:MAG: alpha/beta hydrolase-fold protein [Pseudomonadota bacterium]
MMTRILSSLLVIFTLSAGALARGESRLDILPSLGASDYVELRARDLDRSFHIHVRKPQDYDESNQDYPTIYLLDGDILFPIFGAYHYLLQYDEPSIPEAIIVGISYGAFGAENGNRRGIDYATPPLEDGDPQGGAAAFQRFLKFELIPHVEKTYRSDPDRRILVGQSRGGHFVLFSAYTDPELFWARIASNPSFEPNKEFFFAGETLPDPTNAKLFLASGERDIPAFRADAEAWARQWTGGVDAPWRLQAVTIDSGTHAAEIVDVYQRGLRWIFSDAPR